MACEVREVPSGKEVALLAGHDRQVISVTFSPDGKTLASAGVDKTIRLWDPIGGIEVLTLKGHTQQINALAFSPDGQTLASGDHTGKIRLWYAPQAQSHP